jgi:hypothetical protein
MEQRMKPLALAILMLGIFDARTGLRAAQCSDYYIAEINLVSTLDSVGGHVQTFVGFGPSAQEAEKNALASCSHLKFDLETCLGSDRISGRNMASSATDAPLHLKYMKAVKRITGCT